MFMYFQLALKQPTVKCHVGVRDTSVVHFVSATTLSALVFPVCERTRQHRAHCVAGGGNSVAQCATRATFAKGPLAAGDGGGSGALIVAIDTLRGSEWCFSATTGRFPMPRVTL